jgi:hypothetical protein
MLTLLLERQRDWSTRLIWLASKLVFDKTIFAPTVYRLDVTKAAMSPVGYFALLYRVTGVSKHPDELEYATAVSDEVEPCALGLVHSRAGLLDKGCAPPTTRVADQRGSARGRLELLSECPVCNQRSRPSVVGLA